MKAWQVSAEWKPRESYTPVEREVRDQRAMRGNLIFYNPELKMVDIPIRDLKDGEALLKVGATGVCGSDTLFLGKDEEGYTHYSSHCKFPCVIGHEFSGEIVAVKNVKKLQVGDIVTGENMYWCGECDSCRMGMFNQCENLEEIGFSLNGGFAEYLIVKEKHSYKINDFSKIYQTKEKVFKAGALMEPTSVAYNGLFVRGGGFMPGGNVAVFGCGPVGLASAALLRAAGAAKVFAFDLSPGRLELAKSLGVDHTFNPVELVKQGSSPSQAILELTGGIGAALIAEATEKHNATIPEAEKALAIGGKIVQIGISTEKTAVSSSAFQKKGASYYGTNGNAGHGIFSSVIRLVSSGRIDLSKIITNTYSLDNTLEAIQAAKNAMSGKVMVVL